MSDTNAKKLPETAVFLDTSIPNIARVFDYLISGTANFEADRAAAELIQKKIPSLGKWVRLRRAFVQEAAYQLYQEGFRQFLDLGSGMPADDHIQAFAPEARIVFSDINPVAASYGQSIFEDRPNIEFLRADFRRINMLFYSTEVRRLIDLSQPVAIGVNNIMLFMSETDIRQLAQVLFDWAPVGSIIFASLQTRSETLADAIYEEFKQSCRSVGMPLELYNYDRLLGMLAPWQLEEVLPLVDFLGLPPDFISDVDKTEIDLSFFAGFFKKV